MIRNSISAEAFEAIAQTPPFGSVGYEVEAIEGQRYIWLARAVVNRLKAMRGPGESYSDVILKLVELEGRSSRALGAAVVLAAALGDAPAFATEPVYCSAWQGIRTCTDSSGYVSHESTWNGITTGSDNRGDTWTTSTWQDQETTTVTPGRER